MTKKYILHVKATDPNTNEVVTLTGSFRAFGHKENYFCTVNMINTGIQPIQRGDYVSSVVWEEQQSSCARLIKKN